MSLLANITIEKISIRKPNISFSTIAIYLAVIIAVSLFAFWRTRAEKPNKPQVQNAAAAGTSIFGIKEDPFFSLTSSQSYSSTSNPRVWINYRGVSEMDFRVYKLRDPARFFKNLKDAHQVGEGEDPGPKAQPSILVAINDVKDYFYDSIKNYVRQQISNSVRKRINDALGRNRTYERRPLNVADYARVPLLNPDQMITSWRERLPELENQYDRRQIPLGKREPGVYLVEAVSGTLRAYTVANVTDIALVQKLSPEGDVMVQTVNRKTGQPQANSSVEILKNKVALANGQANNDGVFNAKVPKQKKPATPEGEEEAPQSQYLVMAKNGENFAISDLDSFYFSEYEDGSSKLVGYIYTERPVYRPEHKVYFKGILRNLDSRGYTLLQQKTVNVTIEDPDNGKIYEKDLPLSPRGTFKGEIDIPAKAKLGSYTITAHVGDEATASGYFEVDEYKKPEYKVTVKPDKSYVAVGEKARFTIEAKYFFGAPVANAEVKYYVTRSRHYSYWWRDDETSADYGIEPEESEDGEDYGGSYGDIVEEKEAKLDAKGKLVVEIDAKAPEKEDAEYDYQYRLEAQVTDASRRAIDGAGYFVATRGQITADAYSTNWIYNVGQTALIQVRTSDYEGKPISTRVTLQFNDRRWEKVMKKTEYGEYESWEPKDILLLSADVTTDTRGMATYEYKTDKAGSIYIRTVVYNKGKPVPSYGDYIYVSDGNDEWASSYLNRNYGGISMIPDKKFYSVGETAHILTLLPHDNVSLLVTTEMFNVMSSRRVDVKGRSVMIDVPIESRHAPNFYLNVSYVKNNEFFTDEQNIVVPAKEKLIDLSIVPNKKEYRPRETASYTVIARSLDGKPVPNAEISMGVVDEAIYSIAAEQVGNIKADFYGRRYNRVQTDFSTTFRVTGYAGKQPALIAKENKKNYQLADFKNDLAEQQFAEPTIRKNFRDTAFWNPEVITDVNGKATVDVILPDNLTTWRATFRAVTADTRVGSSVSKVLATKNLILRLETPRFVTAGDTVTLSGIVHNFLKQDKQTQISLQADGGQLLDAAQQRVTIPTSGETRIDWRVTAPNQSGEIRLLAKALTDTESDAIELKLKVLPRGIPQKQSQSVTTTQDAEQTVSMTIPSSADENAKTLRLEAAPSVASTLLGALDYLTSYPYGCTEQTMSSFLPNVVVAQALRNVPNAKIRKDNKLNEKVQKGLDRLYGYQHEDGGWGWWRDDQTNPFMTAYVIDGLTQAKAAGYEIDQSRLDKARESLKAMLDRNQSTGEQWINLEIRSYMVYALNMSGKADASYTDALIARKAELQPYGRALLALALKQRKELVKAQTIATDIASTAKVNNAAAYWTTSWKYRNEVNERFDVEATALSLKALSSINPTSSLLPQAARWLVANRRYGYYWDSTRQTSFAIMGLIDYVKVSRELTPDYQLEVYLNGEPVVNRRVNTTDAIVIERKGRQALNMNQIRIVKRGAGSLYFTASYDYYADEQDVQASQGLSITREYLRLKVEEVGGKPKWQLEPLTGEIRSGDLIVSRLRIVGQKSLYMMIEDPIPAGCEQIESVAGINLNYTEGKWSDWYSSREFRDDKTVLFAYWFDGDATFQYAMRVQIPGDFKVIPARAELMYQPEINAHTDAGFMRILDKK
jgi:uncharacterized protein YfaS (alpha-2-macroglobulin family)